MACLCHFHSRNEHLSNSLGFPGGSGGKESACNTRDPGSMAGREDPLEKEMATHCIILSGKFHKQRGLAAYSLWGHKEIRLRGQQFGNNSKAFTEASSGGQSESFWFIFSVNIGEDLFGICRLLHVSALGVSGVCVYLRWSIWSLIEPECGFALYVHEKEVYQKLNLAQILSEWPGGQNNIFWYQRLFAD